MRSYLCGSLASAFAAVLLTQSVNAETVTFWDADATIRANGKYHQGLHLKQDRIHVEFVSWKGSSVSGGDEVDTQTYGERACALLHTTGDMILAVPNMGPRAKLKSLQYRLQDRAREGRRGNVQGNVGHVYVFVGNKKDLAPTTPPGGEGWLTYELSRKRDFQELDFQGSDNPPPRGKRYYIGFDTAANVYLDDIEFVR